jgi:glycosyltransferase involved in cell wall biosynthesis
MSIPPTGWGAVEYSIANCGFYLEKLGHDFCIVNVADNEEIVRQVNSVAPDIVQVHSERRYGLMERLHAKVKIISVHDGNLYSKGAALDAMRKEVYEKGFKEGTFYIRCLSENIRDYFLSIGIDVRRLFLMKNGARSDLIRFVERPDFPDQSICLGRVTKRKRQHLLVGMDFVDFVGPQGDKDFDYSLPNYIGHWPKEKVHSDLTRYANLVLLSRSEGASLAVCEALMAGLGLVIAENVTANLDLSRPFIRVIPEGRIRERNYMTETIIENQRVAANMRPAIRRYAMENFDWESIVRDYVRTVGPFLMAA